MLKRVLAVGVCALSVSAFAQEEAKEKKYWSGESELGFVKQSGNTETETLTAKQTVVFDAKPWKNTLKIEVSNTSSDDERTGEKYRFVDQLDYFFTDKSYALYRVTWEKDRFSGFDSQSTALLGYGRQFFDTDNFTLKGEVGVGWSGNKLETCPATDLGCDTTISSTLYYLSESLTWKISEPALLGQDLSVEETDDNTIARFSIYVKSQLMANLATKLGYSVKYTDVVPAGQEKRDSEVTATLAYSF